MFGISLTNTYLLGRRTSLYTRVRPVLCISMMLVPPNIDTFTPPNIQSRISSWLLRINGKEFIFCSLKNQTFVPILHVLGVANFEVYFSDVPIAFKYGGGRGGGGKFEFSDGF